MTRKKPSGPVEPVAPAPVAEDEAALRAEHAQLLEEIRAVDVELQAVEAERDAAGVVAESVRARAGQSVELWRAEQTADTAQARALELAAQLKPLKERASRMARYLAPIDRDRLELDKMRRALAAWEKLAEVVPLLDQVAAVVDQARELGQDTDARFTVPNGLARMLRDIGPRATGMGRPQMDYLLRVGIEDGRARVARMSGGGVR